MTRIKLCGLRRHCDIEFVNELLPEYVGFVFTEKSKRYVDPLEAADLRTALRSEITPVGVFVDESPEVVAELIKTLAMNLVQLHGNEDEAYIKKLREQADCKIIKAFQIKVRADIEGVNQSSADYVLLDSGGGSGKCFDWTLLNEIKRPFFLAGGLNSYNVKAAVEKFHPFVVDASSSLETDGFKDKEKMAAFVKAVRERNE